MNVWWKKRICPMHFCTLIVLMCSAGLFCYANISGRLDFENYDSPTTLYGWPNVAEVRHEDGSVSVSEHIWLLNAAIAFVTIAVAASISELTIRRKEFPPLAIRVHLSTAFASMLLAGALLGLNLRLRGWPIPFPSGAENVSQAILYDVLLSLEFVLFLAAILEWAIRRREASGK